MPAAGVFKKEIDLSLYIEIASELKVGVVGPFSKGPFDRTLITNKTALESTFGRPIDDDALCQPFFGVREYLRNGNQAYVVRVESAANPAEYGKSALRGATDDDLTTASDGATSIPATRTLTSASAAFITAGVLVGDIVELHDVSTPADNGFYVITNVAATVLTVDRDWPTGSLSAVDYTVWSAKREGGTDGVTSAQAGRTFTSAGSTFLTNGVQAGDILSIADVSSPEDDGFYVIESVTSNTALVVNRPWRMGGLTTLTFTVYGANHPAGTDGSTAVAGEFSSAGAQFQDHNVQAGDILIIEDVSTAGNNGTYVIEGLKPSSETTTLLVNVDAWPSGSLSSLSYRVVPGTIALSGESKGSWINGYSARTRPNSNSITDFDLEIIDDRGFLVETIYNLNTTNADDDIDDGSAYVTATVGATRLGPGISYTSTFNGGEDGTTGLTDADILGSDVTGTGLQAFRNIEEVELDVILVPGYTSQNIGDGLLQMSEFTRGDCMFITDPPDFPTVSSPQDVVDWHNGTGGFGRTTALNTSHGAVYWPWLKMFDPYHEVDRWTAPSTHAVSAWAQSQNQTKAWFAPAGTRRARVLGATDIRMSPDQGQRNAMQVGANVNPFVKFIREGITVYGQKTLLRTTSALNRIAVRRMVLFIERGILQASKELTFEPSDATTDREFVRIASPLCDFVKDNRGLTDFLILADDTTSPPEVREQQKMISKVFLKPTPTAEIIEVQFILTPQNANFEELLAA